MYIHQLNIRFFQVSNIYHDFSIETTTVFLGLNRVELVW